MNQDIDAYRTLDNPKFILLDEADFFRKGEQEDVRHVSERYIANSNPSFIRALKIQIGEDEQYDEIIREAKSRKQNYEFSMDIVPVSFLTERKSMLGNCRQRRYAIVGE